MVGSQVPDIWSLISGPAGGLMAIAYGFGCASGYGFAIRTAYRAIKERLDRVEREREEDRLACKAEISTLTLRQRELEDMLLGRRALGFFTPIEKPGDA